MLKTLINSLLPLYAAITIFFHPASVTINFRMILAPFILSILQHCIHLSDVSLFDCPGADANNLK